MERLAAKEPPERRRSAMILGAGMPPVAPPLFNGQGSIGASALAIAVLIIFTVAAIAVALRYGREDEAAAGLPTSLIGPDYGTPDRAEAPTVSVDAPISS